MSEHRNSLGLRDHRRRRGSFSTALAAALLLSGAAVVPCACADPADPADRRLRVTAYAADRIYRLTAYVGYQIDLQFETGESFIGLGGGDLAGLSFAAQDNHLFLKPRAAAVDTNLTVLTNRRSYQFEYTSSARRPDPAQDEVIYALRFSYAPVQPSLAGATLERSLAAADTARTHNRAYAYRGSDALKPEVAWDDGVQTRLRFSARGELPAIFVRDDDGSESLVNFSVTGSELIVHRVAAQFVVRRGRLHGCIVNQGFGGSGARLESGTVAPAVERALRDAQ